MAGIAWKVQDKLGEGGSGSVYLAVTPEGQRVAVKVLASKEQSPLLEHEAKLLIRLRHPSIASILGYLKNSSPIFGEDRGPCFWMDYVAGDDLLTAGAKLPRETRTDRILVWFVQALEALSYLHAQDVLHGDLSPGNIRINAQGDFKLIDFGMATAGREVRAGRAATLLYMAPERIGGQNGPACDLFSLGTIFYELIAGGHPRAGCRSLSDMTRKPAKPLLEAAPELEPSHAIAVRVIDRMIVADLKERFSSAGDALEALRGGASVSKASSKERFYPMTMVGAGEVFDRLSLALEKMGERSRILAVHGPTGVGKSRLLREFSFQCALAGRPTREVANDLKPLAEPGVSFLRDLENRDESELMTFFHLRKTRLPSKGALVVLEWNDDRLSERQARLLSRLTQHPDVEDVSLTRLSRENSETLIRMVLGNDPSQEVLSFVFGQSMGNPLMILELVTLIRERGVWTKEGLEDLGGFKSIEDVLTRRIADVTGPARRLLTVLSAAHYAVGLDELLRVMARLKGDSEQDAFETLLLLDDLAARGFVVRDEEVGQYRLSKSELETFLLEKTQESDVHNLHEVWRDILRDAKDPYPQKVHHLAALRDARAAAEQALPAVDHLIFQKQTGEALRLIDEVVSLLEGTAETVALSRLYRAKTNLLGEAGRFEEALEGVEKIMNMAAADEPLDLKRAKYWLVSGLLHQHLDHREEAVRRFQECLKHCEAAGEESLRHYRVRSSALLGLQALNRKEIAGARSWFEKALSEDREGGQRRAEILRNLATALAEEKDWEGCRRCLEESKAIYHDVGYVAGEFGSWLIDGNLAIVRNDPSMATKAYAEAERIAAGKQDDLLLARVWNNQGLLARKQGDLGLAREKGQRSLESFRAIGNLNDLAESLKQNGITEAQCGHFGLAEGYLREVRELTARFPKAAQKVEELDASLKEYRDGVTAALKEEIPQSRRSSADDWNLELLMKRLTRENGDEGRIQGILKQIFENLPNPLKVSFVDRADYKCWILKTPQGGRA